MALKQTIIQMRDLFAQIGKDLEKVERGNKTASQRVRTGTIKLAKIAKLFRKESIKESKKTISRKKTTKKSSKTKPEKRVVKKKSKTKQTSIRARSLYTV